MNRLFVALPCPSPVQEKLAACYDAGLPVRWTPAQQLHLTLRFLGDTPPEQERALRSRLATLSFVPFPLHPDGAAVFPSARRPRVAVQRFRPSLALLTLQAALEGLARELGYPAEPRPFTPHVTLARFKMPDAALAQRVLGRLGDGLAEGWQATAFALYASLLTPQGARYRCVERYPA